MVIIIIIVVSPRRCAGRLIHRHGHHLRVASIEVVIMMGHLSCLVPFAYPGVPCDSRGTCGAAGQRCSLAWSSSSLSLLALVVVRVVLVIAMVAVFVYYFHLISILLPCNCHNIFLVFAKYVHSIFILLILFPQSFRVVFKSPGTCQNRFGVQFAFAWCEIRIFDALDNEFGLCIYQCMYVCM